MKAWNERTHEIAYLLNPAFCGRILYSSIKAYNEKTRKSFPFPLIYLILPLVLHKKTRININSKTKFHNWIQDNSYLLIDYAQRTRNLVQITNESLEFLLQTEKVILTDSGELEISNDSKKLGKIKSDDGEILECLKKSEHVGKWFATAGPVKSIYIELGVRP